VHSTHEFFALVFQKEQWPVLFPAKKAMPSDIAPSAKSRPALMLVSTSALSSEQAKAISAYHAHDLSSMSNFTDAGV
jgi:hypothetical protein